MRGITFGPDGNAYVTAGNGNTPDGAVFRFDGLTGNFLGEFISPLGSGRGLFNPGELIIGPDGNLYIAARSGLDIRQFDGLTGDFLGIVARNLSPSGLVLKPAAVPDPTIDDACDVGGGPNDIKTVTASYDGDFDEIVVVMDLCDVVDNRTSYQVYFDHEDTTNLDGDGIDDGPDTLDPNPDCVDTWDDKMTHKGGNDSGPGAINVDGNTLTFRAGVVELDPFLMSNDTVLIWTDSKLKNVTDKAPNTEPGDGCAKPEVAGEVLSLELN